MPRGRPPIGAVAMSGAEREARRKERVTQQYALANEALAFVLSLPTDALNLPPRLAWTLEDLHERARLAGLTVADAFDDDCDALEDDNSGAVAEWVTGCDRDGTGEAARASILAWVAKHCAGADTTPDDTANDCDKEIVKWATASGDIGRDMLLAWVAEHGGGAKGGGG